MSSEETCGRPAGGVGRPVPSARDPFRVIQLLVVALLLLLHAGLIVSSLRQNFVTIDESGHIPSGLAHWQTGSFTAYRVNPPLGRLLAVLPLVVADAEMPYPLAKDAPGRRIEWDLARGFAEGNADRYFDLVCLARWAGVAWSLLGGLLIYCWGRDLYGGLAGCLGLALWCLDPNIIAHAQLVTPDIPATVMLLASSYLFWHYLKRPTWTRSWFLGIVLGLAQLTKFTLLILYALWPVLAVLVWSRTGHGAWRTRVGQLLLMFAVSVLVINIGYGFEESGRRLGDFVFVSEWFGGETPEKNRFRGTAWQNLPLPVPANYLLGIDSQRRDFESGWPFYLAGEWRLGGWWYFYLYALAVKLPLAALVLIVAGTLLLLGGHGGSGWRDELALALPAVVLLVVISTQTGLQYFRYALPLMPFLYIGAARWAVLCRPPRWLPLGAAGALVLWIAVSCWRIHPHHLSYFNELAGGADRGADHLVDSNLDWGQDLLFLKAWLDEHPEAQPLGLAYFNTVDPRIVGIDFHLPPRLPENWKQLEASGSKALGPQPGWFAVSVHFVHGGYFQAADGQGRWRHIPLHGLSYFRHFQPIARAGHTAWIYHLSAEEVSNVRRQLGLPP